MGFVSQVLVGTFHLKGKSVVLLLGRDEKPLSCLLGHGQVEGNGSYDLGGGSVELNGWIQADKMEMVRQVKGI